MARIHDLSPPLSPRIAVWPGDVPFTREVTTPPDGTTFSSVRTTLHLGSHADAPLHIPFAEFQLVAKGIVHSQQARGKQPVDCVV